MRTLLRSALCFCLLLVHPPASEGLRMRDEQLPGLAAARTVPLPASFASKEGRITGGDTSTLAAWPSIVSIQNWFGFPFCSGVIIDDAWILTAASCVSGLRARNLLILAGTLTTWNNTAEAYFVDGIYAHCNFDKPLYHNDIALLHLNATIQYNQETAKIPLAEVDDLQEGEKLSFAGWGKTDPESANMDSLQEAAGSYLPVDKCRAKLGDTDDVDLGHVCVDMVAGKGMCHGDTGGPLINEQGQLVGIANWGVPCGRGFPDVYGRVAFYHDWIRTTINGCSLVKV